MAYVTRWTTTSVAFLPSWQQGSAGIFWGGTHVLEQNSVPYVGWQLDERASRRGSVELRGAGGMAMVDQCKAKPGFFLLNFILHLAHKRVPLLPFMNHGGTQDRNQNLNLSRSLSSGLHFRPLEYPVSTAERRKQPPSRNPDQYWGFRLFTTRLTFRF